MHLKIQRFKQKLLEFCKNCNVAMCHNESPNETGDFGIWYELGENRIDANDKAAEKCPIVSVQFWTKSEYSEIVDKFEKFFDDAGYAWENQTYADYDTEIQRYHYGWTVEII